MDKSNRISSTQRPPGKGWLTHFSIFPPSSTSSSGSSSPPRGYLEDQDVDEDEDSEQDGSKPSDPPSPSPRSSKSKSNHRSIIRSKRNFDSDDEEEDGEYGDDLDPPDYFSSSLNEHQHQNVHGKGKGNRNGTNQLGIGGLGREIVISDGEDGMRDTLMSGLGEIPRRLEVFKGRLGVWGELRSEGGVARYKDAGFLALWLTSVLGIIIGLCFVWGATDPAPSPPSAPPTQPYRTPFSTLLHTIPLLAVLTGIAVVLPIGFLFLLKKAVRPVITGTAIAVPFLLFLCSWWGFVASFETVPLPEDTINPAMSGWWSTTALRVFSLIPLLLAVLFGRMVWMRRERLDRTVGVVELSAGFLLDHPPLLLLQPILLAALALLSLPYLTLLLRLLLIGYYRHPRENTYIWHVRPYADLLAIIVVVCWLWTWAVVRGVGRVVVAAVVGDWYFHREDADRRPVLDTTVSALHRATGPSLGSVCISGLIVAVLRIVGQLAARARRIVHPRANVLPGPLLFLTALTPLFTAVASILDQLNGYASVYVGITGEPFWPSAKRAVRLAGKRKGGAGRLLDYTLIKLLLTLCSTTLALLTAMAGYLFAVHALGAPTHAPLTALLCAFVPFLAFRAGAGVLSDASDSLFICYAIDREAGGQHCEPAAKAFSADLKPPNESMA